MNWIDFKTKRPKLRETVIGYFPEGTEGTMGHPCVDTAYFNGGKLVSNFPNSTAYCFEATHWMPMPEPPTEGSDSDSSENPSSGSAEDCNG